MAQYAAPLSSFLRTETGGAGALLAATVLALVWANSPWGDSYFELWSTTLEVRLGAIDIEHDLQHWVNDGLMVLFFFVIGMELRRQLSMGELTDRSRRSIPVLGALAGLAVPALIYLGFNPDGEAARGWGIAMATDTAFVLGALALVGPAFPGQLRVFLLSVAVVDDVGALTAIAVFYSEDVSVLSLAIAAVAVAGIVLLAKLQIWRGPAYLVGALVLWLALLESGVHPTLGGVVAGLLISAYPPRREDVARARRLARAFGQSPSADLARSAKLSVERAVSPNERLEQLLHPWTSLVVVPIFALANAGVALDADVLEAAVSSPIVHGIVVGLVVGKLTGIGLVSALAVRAGLGRLPGDLTVRQLWGGAALSGIGFTVSLFVTNLAFESQRLQDEARIGILAASLFAGVLGWALFRIGDRLAKVEPDREEQREFVAPVDPAVDHIRGPVDAPLTLVEYADFECPFCGRATGVVDELLARFGGRLRYVFRHLPLADIHPHALLAAEAAEAAGAQDAFWKMHDRLFAHQDELEPYDLVDHAAAIGIDIERFAGDLGRGEHAARVRADVESAEANGAEGTPTFYVNGHRHSGANDAATLAAALVDGTDIPLPPPLRRLAPPRRVTAVARPALGRLRDPARVGAPAPLVLDGLAETPDADGAFPRLTAAQVAVLEPHGRRIPLVAGTPVFDLAPDGVTSGFVVVLSGAVAMVEGFGEDNVVRVVHGAGRFLGELGVLAGEELLMTPVGQRAGEALLVAPARLSIALGGEPELRDVVLRTYLLRRSILLGLGSDGERREGAGPTGDEARADAGGRTPSQTDG